MQVCGKRSFRTVFSTLSHTKSSKPSIPTEDQHALSKDVAEEVASSRRRMMGTISSHPATSSSSPASPGNHTIVPGESIADGKPGAYGKGLHQHHRHHLHDNTAVVPKPQDGNVNNGKSQQLPSPTTIPSDDPQKPTAPVFARGVFESLHQSNDVFQRPGFDRVVSSQILNDIWLVGVIDGHGHSPICAEYLAESFPVVVRLLLERPQPGSSSGHADRTSTSNHPRSSQQQQQHRFNLKFGHTSHSHQMDQETNSHKGAKSTSHLDHDHHHQQDSHGNYYCEILKEAFKICSREWDSSPQIKSSEYYRNSGAVALLALVHTTKQQIYMASAGDCRALVSQTTGRGYRFVHSAHRTDNVKERLRILQQGGKIKSVHGVLRVGGSLIPTRVFGDVGLKMDFFGRVRPFLDPDPEIATVEVSQAAREQQAANASKGGQNENKFAFTVLASDGLWDTLSTENVVEICTEALKKNKSAEEIAHLLGKASMQSTDDDVSIVVLVW